MTDPASPPADAPLTEERLTEIVRDVLINSGEGVSSPTSLAFDALTAVASALGAGSVGEMIRRCSVPTESTWRDLVDLSYNQAETDPHSYVLALRATVAAQAEALREAYTDIAWNDYNTGHERSDGRWTHAYLSDAEALARDCGLDLKEGNYDAALVKSLIPAAVEKRLAALSSAPPAPHTEDRVPANADRGLVMSLQDVTDLDDVVRELGLESSHVTPAEEVRNLRGQIDALQRSLCDALENPQSALAGTRPDPASPTREELETAEAIMQEVQGWGGDEVAKPIKAWLGTPRPRPRVFRDGDAWCALLGPDLQEGVAGFGDTIDGALGEFNRARALLTPSSAANEDDTK